MHEDLVVDSVPLPGRRAALKLAGAGVGVPSVAPAGGYLPAKQMQAIVQADGSVTNRELAVGIDRTHIGPVTLRGIPIEAPFEVNGDLTFQPRGLRVRPETNTATNESFQPLNAAGTHAAAR